MSGYSSHDNDFSGVDLITKKSLNALTGHRTVSIQEAVHEIAGLDLVICSDYLTKVSLGRALFTGKRKEGATNYKKNDLVDCYRHRDEKYEDLSLEEYFYEEFRKQKFYTDPTTKRNKYRILAPQGLNCRPCYPPTYEYARGILIMHKPWSHRNPLTDFLKQKKEDVIKLFLKMMGARNFPPHVLAEYHRAVKYSQQYCHECIQKEGTHNNDNIDLNTMDDDELDLHIEWEHSRHLSAQNTRTTSNRFGDLEGYIGIDHDWSSRFFTDGDRKRTTRADCTWTEYLKEQFYGSGVDTKVHLPLKKDGTGYKLDDLNMEQQTIVICALDAIIKFLNNDPEYRPFRATVVGCGGTGKSFIINTLISLVRSYTNCNDSLMVTAPSGGAAYNVQGCTLHRGLALSVNSKTLTEPLSEDSQIDLGSKLERLLMLIVDERSMINSQLIAGAERNLRHCVFGQQNQTEFWGGIPAVILFGDDYQLPPVQSKGAIEGYAQRNNIGTRKASKKTTNEQLMEELGHTLLIEDLTENVFKLTENYRTKKDPEYGAMLERLRVGNATQKDAERFMKQCIHYQTDDIKSRIENDPRTLWLYTRNCEKNEKNLQKLIDLSKRTKVPIARLQCQWSSNRHQGQGIKSVVRSHFHSSNIVFHTDICVGAPVALTGINIVPEVGLYNGARGKIIDIIYDTVEGPNNKHQDHLPRCVIVDFPGLKLNGYEPWDPEYPTVSQFI